jgi:hypothetical protein
MARTILYLSTPNGFVRDTIVNAPEKSVNLTTLPGGYPATPHITIPDSLFKSDPRLLAIVTDQELLLKFDAGEDIPILAGVATFVVRKPVLAIRVKAAP